MIALSSQNVQSNSNPFPCHVRTVIVSLFALKTVTRKNKANRIVRYFSWKLDPSL